MNLKEYLDKNGMTVESFIGTQYTPEAYTYVANLPVEVSDGNVATLSPEAISDAVKLYKVSLPASFCVSLSADDIKGLFEDIRDFQD